MAACSASSEPDPGAVEDLKRAFGFTEEELARTDEFDTSDDLVVFLAGRFAEHEQDLTPDRSRRPTLPIRDVTIRSLAIPPRMVRQRRDRRLRSTRRPSHRRARRTSVSSRGDPDSAGDDPPGHSRCCGSGCSRCKRRWAS
jgi:hypothetical protein